MLSETAFYEDPKPLLGFFALGGAFGLAGLVGLVLAARAGLDDWTLFGLLGFFLLLGFGLVAAMAARWRRRRVPYLVLAPDGFRCPGLAGVVPWSQVDHAEVVGMYGNVFTTFRLTHHGQLPTRDGARANVRVSKRAREVRIGGPAPRGLDLEAYGALIAAAIAAGRAHR